MRDRSKKNEQEGEESRRSINERTALGDSLREPEDMEKWRRNGATSFSGTTTTFKVNELNYWYRSKEPCFVCIHLSKCARSKLGYHFHSIMNFQPQAETTLKKTRESVFGFIFVVTIIIIIVVVFIVVVVIVVVYTHCKEGLYLPYSMFSFQLLNYRETFLLWSTILRKE